MVPELKAAALDSAIQVGMSQSPTTRPLTLLKEALSLKISRERIGEELDKMMKGKCYNSGALLIAHSESSLGRDPLRSIQLINDLSLYPSIFSIPETISSTFSSTPGPPITSIAAATLLHALLKPTTSTSSSFAIPPIHKTLLSLALSPSTKSRLFLAAALTPYRGITYTDSKNKSHLAVEAAIREGPKLGTQNHYLDGIPALFVAADLLKNPSPSNDKLKSPSERVAIGEWFPSIPPVIRLHSFPFCAGLLLREKCVHNPNTGSHWTTSLLFSLVQELVPMYDAVEDKLDGAIRS
jgi:tRNA nucleotidyltransferase (CCA-adding enzyme)